MYSLVSAISFFPRLPSEGLRLSILGIVQRGTRDLDLLDVDIPDIVQNAAYDFSKIHSLAENWLNSGPSSLTKDLPQEWKKNLQPLYSGKNLKLLTLSRIDLIRTKLWAMCDRMRDIDDLIAIAPTVDELKLAAEWVKPLDGNKNWAAHVNTTVGVLKEKLGYG